MQLTPHYLLSEFVVSQEASRLGIDNTPGPRVVEALRYGCEIVLEPMRVELEQPIIVSSGYRCDKLNRAIGSAPNSQHKTGNAADIYTPAWSASLLFDWIVRNRSILPFDQLILEYYSWVHVSWSSEPRGELLVASLNDRKKTVYTRLGP